MTWIHLQRNDKVILTDKSRKDKKREAQVSGFPYSSSHPSFPPYRLLVCVSLPLSKLFLASPRQEIEQTGKLTAIVDLKRRESYRGRKKENLYGWLENSRPLHKSERFWISRLLASRISTRFTYRHLERRSVTIFNHSFSGKKMYRLTNQKPSYMKFISVTFLRVREKGTCRQPLNWLPRRQYARMLSGEHLPLHAQYCRSCSWRSGLWVTNFEYYFALKKEPKKKKAFIAKR